MVVKKLDIKDKKMYERKTRHGKERRQLKLKSKKHSEIVIKILPLWENLRKEITSKQQRFEIINEILQISKKSLLDLCMAHDTSRVFECVIHHATEVQRWQVYSELQTHFVDLAKSRYGKFVMLALINYGEKQYRLGILKAFTNHIARLVKHKFSCELVDTLYNEYATAMQRGEMVQELYGNKYVLQLAENNIYTLADTLKFHPDKHSVLMNNLTQLLILLINKGLNKYSIVQHILLEYFKVINTNIVQLKTHTKSSSSTNYQITQSVVPMSIVVETNGDGKTSVPKSLEDNFSTLLETLIEGQIVPMLHTREGVRIGLQILWASNVSKRKMLVKNLKTCVTNIATNEHGHLFLIGLLDSVDDIVLLQKTIIKEMLEDIELMITHPNARKVLLYALSPRDRRHFSPQFISSIFGQGDRNLYTKKSLSYRALELRTAQVSLLPTLLRVVKDQMNDIFIGNCDNSDDDDHNNKGGGSLPFLDLGRLVLLTEILIKSSPYHLDPEHGTLVCTRSKEHTNNNDDDVNDDSSKKCLANLNAIISAEDTILYATLRKDALKVLIHNALVPPFNPLGPSLSASGNVSRDELRLNRRRKAIQTIEQKIAKEKKLTIKPFASGQIEDEDVTMQSVDDNNDNDDKDSLRNHRMPFLERPEGHLLVRRLLQEEKQHKDYTFGHMIMKYVPAENLLSWTRCNRSCFILVNLYELGDEKICEQLRGSLNSVLNELAISPLPGAKILHKHFS